ncbi:hypothetical protein [Malonomonas rubra]|uniref:hypothetical protein n=1 Tax=Malonomonas rubra TaxID=57040 RepID=UPI0026EF45F3|nr:hypothetical protein [Malonomonas rubra]
MWLLFLSPVHAFDHQHQNWDLLLKKYVHWDRHGVASQVDYAAFMRQEAQLDRNIAELSNYMSGKKLEQLAF